MAASAHGLPVTPGPHAPAQEVPLVKAPVCKVREGFTQVYWTCSSFFSFSPGCWPISTR